VAGGQELAGARVADNVALAPLTTLRVGPVARRVITCTTSEQIAAALRAVDAAPDGPVLVLAGGSNVVIADDLADVTVVRLPCRSRAQRCVPRRVRCGTTWCSQR
jgi:UDP-N-acetylmuramate dehydrogenase